jgi:hypothetical protein
MIRVLKTLSNEDLAIWRSVLADKELVDEGHTGYSKDEARNAIIRYYKTLGDLLKSYEIPMEEEGIVVSGITGTILQVE